MRAGFARTIGPLSVRLPAQERRNVELVLFAGVMHRALPAMLVEPLRGRPLGIFGDRRFVTRFVTRFLSRSWRILGAARLGGPSAGQRAARSAAGADRRGPRARRCFMLFLLAAAEADRGQALQQRPRPVLRMAILRQFAAPGADLVLRRHRQLIDPRHARRPHRQPLRLRRNERRRLQFFRFVRLRLARGRIDEQ